MRISDWSSDVCSSDLVMSGLGRTGVYHAFEREEVVPDLLCLAKGLGGGYQPIAAVMAHGNVVDAIVGGSGAFQHGHTYVGPPVACAAALAVQRKIGSASCRERVCQYVSISVVAVSLKKKNHKQLY